MYKFCFVILHYKAVNDTIECIESILNNIAYKNIKVLVVDNNSPDKSGEFLRDKYKNLESVIVLLNDKNDGFATGNNIGYQYALEKLGSDFVAIINNDTVIQDEYFIDKIIGLYNSDKFHIMGPDIVAKDGQHQNPYKMEGISLEEVNDFIINYKRKLFSRIIRMKIKKNQKLNSLIKIFKKPKPRMVNLNYRSPHQNIVLHGAAIIFSPLYIEKEEYAFYPGTFMYGEEDILYHICLQKGYRILYSPITSIYHKEDASTDSIIKSDYGKLKFIYYNQRNSYLILKRILEQK